MFTNQIKSELTFIKDYFSLLLNNEKISFPQSIILYGEDSFLQYLLALNLAKILNCTDRKSMFCNCLNCEWSRNNTHPAIITVSKNDFKPDGDNSKSVISVKQTLEIKNSLATTSEYHRVFIFCDSEIKEPNATEITYIKKFKENGFKLPYENNHEDGKFWLPKGLTKKVLQEESSNSMLKCIEEPPPRTTFFFLAKDKNDLIETIISRSQCFYVPSQHFEDNDLTIISNEFKYYPEIDRLEINNIAKRILDNATALNVEPEAIFTKFQKFIKNMTLVNTKNPQLIEKMIEDIKILHDAQAQLASYIKPQVALENAIYLIFKNWENYRA